MRLAALSAALISLSLALAGCGGSDSASTGSTEVSGSAGAPAGVRDRDEQAPKTRPSKAERFKRKGYDNSIQESGEEASASQLAQASTALHGYLDATARGDWAGACELMAEPIQKQLAAGLGGSGDQSCPELLSVFFAETQPATFAEAAKADVGSFRVEGSRGYVLYHGAEGVDYQMSVAREDGRWKVAALASSPLP
jgi:hypothetical protein